MVTVGIDPHKHVHIPVAVGGDGRPVGRPLTVKNDALLIITLLKWMIAGQQVIRRKDAGFSGDGNRTGVPLADAILPPPRAGSHQDVGKPMA